MLAQSENESVPRYVLGASKMTNADRLEHSRIAQKNPARSQNELPGSRTPDTRMDPNDQ